MPERDEAQRKADLEWLYGAEPTAEERTRVMQEAELAELRKREARATAAAAGAAPRPQMSAPSAPPAAPARPSKPPRMKRPGSRRRTARRVVGVVAVLLVAWVAWLVAVPMYAWSTMSTVDAFPTASRPAQQPGTAILMVGSDSRSNLTAAERKELGTGNAAGGRTDTIMILFIPKKGQPLLLSLPRDSYVPIPGHGSSKINAAFAWGGPKLLIQTVEQATGLRMDGYLEIGMGGFSDLVDAVGGVHMCLPQAIKDKDSNTDLKAGCQTLDGPQALGYVRMRHQDPEGDLGRVKRQRAVMEAIAKKAATPSTLMNPVKYWRFNMALRNSLTRDGLSAWQIPGVGRGVMDIARGKGLQLTVPVSSTNAVTSAGSSVLWDTTKSKAMFQQMATGSTENFSKYAK